VSCRWGIPFGPYVYFPVLGPSSAAEAVSVTLDLALAPADLLLPQLAIQSSRRNQLWAIRAAHAEQGGGVDLYTFERIAYRQDRLRQVRDEPAFVPPTAAELENPRAYGTCGYTRPPAPE
jgi:ABC-type transporter lipoprotein component MlaA